MDGNNEGNIPNIVTFPLDTCSLVVPILLLLLKNVKPQHKVEEVPPIQIINKSKCIESGFFSLI